MKIRQIRFFCLIIGFLQASCISQKKVTYFQSENDSTSLDLKFTNKIVVQPGDILSVSVSSLNAQASEMFNPHIGSGLSGQLQTIQTVAPQSALGYLVTDDGSITLPLVGKLPVSGLTVTEVSSLATKELNRYLEQPTVNVRMMNFKISVLGEVARPALYTIPNERITMPEALALAGDLTIFGKRDNILLIREVNGKKEFNRIDLTKRDLFSSSTYYLQPNDIIYVQPVKGKITASDRAVQVAPIIISGLSLAIVLLVNMMK